jgi:4-hydroxyphenylpyruvate dioxygenase-like putative hemolysin
VPIQFTRIDHIAMGVEDADQQAAILEGLYGLKRERTWEDAEERGVGFRIGATDVRWEVVQPTSDDAPLRAFLDSPRGPGVYRVGIEVPELGATAKSLEALGVRASSGSSESRLLVSPDGAGEGVQLRFFSGDAHPEAQAASGETANGDPALGIRRIDHVCTAYHDRDVLSDHYTRMLGMRQIWRTPEGSAPDFGDCVLEIPGGQMFWEVIQPVGEDSFIQSFLDRRGPAVHHVAFEVADFDAAKLACEYYEVPTFDEHDDSTDGIRWRDLFIHPRHTGGLLTQIFWEEQPHTWVRSDKVRPDGFTG